MEQTLLQALPDTILGLLAFLFSGAGFFLWRTQRVFLDYIQTKNGIMEKNADRFAEALKEQRQDFTMMLREHSEKQLQKSKEVLETAAQVSKDTVKEVAAEISANKV